MHKAQLGTVSHGTLRTQDLLESLGWELKFLSDEPAHKALVLEAMALLDVPEFEDSEEASDLVSEIVDALMELAPPYCYFGAHEDDGADFGFWPIWDSIDELPTFNDLADVPADIDEDYQVVNDHGNVTVYSANGEELLGIV